MTEPEARGVYEFGGFRLDPRQRSLCSSDGNPIALPARTFDTLLYLVESHGQVLDKGTLLKAVWPNLVVEENSLNQNVSILRRALGEGPGSHRFIVTVPGRGYQFVADVRRVSRPAAQAQGAEAHTATAGGQRGGTVAAARASIAVLPFANLTRDPDKEYFGDGMAEELIHMLARIPGLKVPARTSSFAYKGQNSDIRRIARDLDVGAVLEGSVRSAGERIRVTAQLIDAESGYHLWTESYDRQFEDLFRLQDELAGAIVEALRVNIGGITLSIPSVAPPSQDLEAYHLYLQATSVANVGLNGIPRSLDLLQLAVARDPRFARAYSAIAALRTIAVVLDIPLPGTLADAEREVQHALELDSSLGSAHAALGTIKAAQGKWIEADERFQEAFARDATDPQARQAYGLHVAGSTGFLHRYLQMSQEAYCLAPAWAVNVLNLTVAHQVLGHFEEASKYIDLAIQLGIPKTIAPVADVLSNFAVHGGRYAEAAEYIIDALTPTVLAVGGREVVEAVFGAIENPTLGKAAVAALDKHRAQLAAQDLTQIVRRRFMLWYTLLDAPNQAFEIANASLDYFARGGTIGSAWAFIWMPTMLPFRQDPRFQEFVARLGLPAYWQRYGPPDNCDLRDGRLVVRQ